MRLILLPGMDGTGELLAEFIDSLKPEFRAEVIAYPGDAPMDYKALANHVERRLPRGEPFLLLGESFSDPIAIDLASRKPPGLRGLVLCATFATSPQPWFRPLRALLRLPLPVLPARLMMPAMMGAWTTREWTRREQKAIDALHARTARQRLSCVLEVDHSELAGRICCPVLYLQASHDRLVPASSWTKIKSLAPHASFTRLHGPHFILQAKPAQAADAIKREFRDMLDAENEPREHEPGSQDGANRGN